MGHIVGPIGADPVTSKDLKTTALPTFLIAAKELEIRRVLRLGVVGKGLVIFFPFQVQDSSKYPPVEFVV